MGIFRDLTIPKVQEPPIKRRYSVTSDIVAYRRCPRQYGAFSVYKYAPAYQTQLYFGKIIHQVLDRCHNHYSGKIDITKTGKIPDDGNTLKDSTINKYFEDLAISRREGKQEPLPPSTILKYFIEVENGLRNLGISAINKDLRLKAVRVLQRFNQIEGKILYPKVVDTEHKLQTDRNDHILHGVVDLLVADESDNAKYPKHEIWDYKGTSRIGLTKNDEDTYRFQMQVYAKLYELKHNIRPQKAILYFVNELDVSFPLSSRPKNAIIEYSLEDNLSEEDIERAMKEFDVTRNQIEESRRLDKWKPAKVGEISEKDCTICDLRWDCPTPNKGKGVALRYP